MSAEGDGSVSFETDRRLGSFVGAAVTNFFPSVVGTLGYSRNITYLLTAREWSKCTAGRSLF